MKEIKSTYNYNMFKKLQGNRATSIARINKIKKSIMEVGYITSPILVNENMEIIDGQGRFEALKQLELPIEYIVQSGISVKECIAMNIYQTNWVLLDYINSYADKGIQSYIYLIRGMKKYPLIKGSYAYAITLYGTDGFNTRALKNGELEISETQYKEMIEKLEYINPIIQKYGNIKRIGLITRAMLHCYNIKGIDRKRLKQKVEEILEWGKIPPIPTVQEAVQFLEEIYNKNKPCETLYIYTEYRKATEERELRGIMLHNEKIKKMYQSFDLEEKKE